MPETEEEVKEVKRQCLMLQDGVTYSDGFYHIENHRHVPDPNNYLVAEQMIIRFCTACGLCYFEVNDHPLR